jgi:hypothetical protein
VVSSTDSFGTGCRRHHQMCLDKARETPSRGKLARPWQALMQLMACRLHVFLLCCVVLCWCEASREAPPRIPSLGRCLVHDPLQEPQRLLFHRRAYRNLNLTAGVHSSATELQYKKTPTTIEGRETTRIGFDDTLQQEVLAQSPVLVRLPACEKRLIAEFSTSQAAQPYWSTSGGNIKCQRWGELNLCACA